MRPVEEVFGDILATFLEVFRISTIERVSEHQKTPQNEFQPEFRGPILSPESTARSGFPGWVKFEEASV